MAKRQPEIVASREEAVEKMYQAGLKHLHRPNQPWDPYFTTEAVRAWAEAKADEFIAKGHIRCHD